MKIIKTYPPNFAWLVKVFPQIKGKPGILYAWGDRIYNPSGIKVPKALIDHETVHGERQLAFGNYMDVDEQRVREWWERYGMSPSYRLQEEIPAHQAEWRSVQELKIHEGDKENYLGQMADRLSGPLYGNLVGRAEALDLITKGE